MVTTKIRPIGDRILIRRHEQAEQEREGIIIPDSAREKQQEATVIAVGTGRRTEEGILMPIEVSIGDTVLVSQFGGDEVRLGECVYMLVRENDILGILTNAPLGATK